MAGNTANISIRMDAQLKEQADELFAELGMNLSTAFNIFFHQSLREDGLPFDVSLNQPTKETIAATLDLGWRDRTKKELKLMENLIPLLKKLA